MNNNRDVFSSLLYSLLAKKIYEDISKHAECECSDETNQVVAEIERLNLMSAIDKALDSGDKDTFIQLTNELQKVGVSQ